MNSKVIGSTAPPAVDVSVAARVVEWVIGWSGSWYRDPLAGRVPPETGRHARGQAKDSRVASRITSSADDVWRADGVRPPGAVPPPDRARTATPEAAPLQHLDRVDVADHP